MSDDSIFREVDEAVRQDKLKSLWDKYGLWVVAGAVLIIASVSGYKFWVYWTTEQAKIAGARFVGGITHIEDGKTSEALDVFKSLADEGPRGYQILSRFQLAALYAKDGKKDEAIKIYDDLAFQSGIGDVQQGFAKIQAATLKLDDASFDDMRKRLDALAVTGNPWRHSARELLGLSAYHTGDISAAERFFSVMLSDQRTPANMRRRAEMMLSLLVQSGGDAAPAGK
jgi:hypothetical protein